MFMTLTIETKSWLLNILNKAIGIIYFAKSSQSFIVDILNWLQNIINQIMFADYALLFNSTMVDQASDSMAALT